MKTITLTKNYLVEGNIIPKGTRIEFKEKLDFLPADIWEKAKDITDEHERFEFIKAELNKLGDDYSDDEIVENLHASEFSDEFINEMFRLRTGRRVTPMTQQEFTYYTEVTQQRVESLHDGAKLREDVLVDTIYRLSDMVEYLQKGEKNEEPVKQTVHQND